MADYRREAPDGRGAGGREARGGMTMAITITESAAKHVATQLVRRGKGVGLRLRASARRDARGSPTSSSSPTRGSRRTSRSTHGVTVLVDQKTGPYLGAPELDFAREG